MIATKYIDKALQNPLQLALGVAVIAAAAYFIVRQTVGAALDGAGGLISGNNPITEGTPYEGGGVVGTVGAATDKASGGLLSTIGGWIGGKIADATEDKQTDTFYTVVFPDGSRHAVAADTVSGAGVFSFSGVRYQISSTRQTDGLYHATRV
jgi:hypothetical protein